MRKSALFWFGLIVTILVSIGLVVLSSASEAKSIRLRPSDPQFLFWRQAIYIGLGTLVAVGAALFDYHKWRDCRWLAWLAFAVVLALLAAVFWFERINGSYRWIDLGPVNVQPSEFAKIVTVILLAVWMDRSSWRVELFGRGAAIPMLLIGALALPIMLEPDFGSVMVVLGAGFLVMFVAGTRIRHLLPLFLVGVCLVGVRVATNDNRMARLKAFFSDTDAVSAEQVSDPAAKRAAEQVEASLVAIRNAKMWGAGLGQSMQKHYYLPEAHTDFVFAVGAEELGIVFSLGVVFLFTLFFAISVYIARKASDRLGRFLVIGMAFIVYFQAMFNVGVICKALPTKGMALPFFSYGGTNLLCTFFAVGTILSVGIHSYREKKSVVLRKVLAR